MLWEANDKYLPTFSWLLPALPLLGYMRPPLASSRLEHSVLTEAHSCFMGASLGILVIFQNSLLFYVLSLFKQSLFFLALIFVLPNQDFSKCLWATHIWHSLCADQAGTRFLLGITVLNNWCLFPWMSQFPQRAILLEFRAWGRIVVLVGHSISLGDNILEALWRKGVRGPAITMWTSHNVTVTTVSQAQLSGVTSPVLLVQILWNELSLVFFHDGGDGRPNS